MDEIDITKIIFAFVISMSIPSAVTAFCFWMIQKKITNRDNKRDELDKARKKMSFTDSRYWSGHRPRGGLGYSYSR